MKRVLISGHFDPYPHYGHRIHMQMAKRLGDWLIVVVSSDEDAIRKKGFCVTPQWERMDLIKDLNYVDEVIAVIPSNGLTDKSILKMKPDIFAKGGDRTINNIPQAEIDACKQVGCQLVTGVGHQLESSRDILRRIIKARKQLKIWEGESAKPD